MSTNTRITCASLSARMDESDARLERMETMLLALVERDAPAKQARKAPAKKAPAKKAAPKPATKGAQTRATLSRKEFNRTVTAKARFAGGDTYKRVLASWTQVQAMRETSTPDEIIALFA